MHFVSFVASERRRGNSELLGRFALSKALENGADSGEIVYLRDFSIRECNGCMKCVFKEVPCPLEDDAYRLFEKISRADALFLVAPTYVLSIPGSLKLLIDRYLLMPGYFDKLYGRPAVSVGVAGLPGWEQFQLPLMNLFLLGMGFKIKESFVLYGAGPGEVFLKEEQIARVEKAVMNLCAEGKISSEEGYKSQLSRHCPICFSTVFERIGGDRFRCPVCLSEGELRENGFYFKAESLNAHRWSREKMADHFQNWILKTKGLYRERLGEIRKKTKQWMR